MNGLAEIRAINEHAQAVFEDKQRRARGLKPKSIIGEVSRKVRLEKPRARVAHFGQTIYVQGREVTL